MFCEGDINLSRKILNVVSILNYSVDTKREHYEDFGRLALYVIISVQKIFACDGLKIDFPIILKRKW